MLVVSVMSEGSVSGVEVCQYVNRNVCVVK